jgi:multidrug efflux system membrane fusion protein
MNEPETSASPLPAVPSKPNPKSHGMIWVGIVVLIVCGLGWYYYRHHAGANAAGSAGAGRAAGNFPVPVVIGHARQKDVPIYLDGLGTVQAFNTVTVHTRVDGQLVKVAFTEGQEVKTGDLLAQIDPAPYQAALDQAVAKKAQDNAQLTNARLDLQRYADLLKTDGTTQQTYDTQKALVDQLAATVKADDAAIASAQVNLDYTNIHSPIDGRTGIRQVDQGNIVHAADAGGLVVLTQLKPISIIFTLPETAFLKLQENQDATGSNYTVLAVARDNTNVLATGQLAVIDNEIDPTTGTLKLKANFANENLHLWPGQFVNTRLLLETREDSVVVPASVVQRGPNGSFAFIVSGDSTNQTVKMRPITVAQIDNGEALIDDGLDAGEAVVVDGQYKLQDGSKVRSSAPAGGAGGSHRKRPDSGAGTNPVSAPTNTP